MKLDRRLPASVRQAATYGLALMAAKGVSFAMVPVFTHHLVPGDYGRLDVLQTLANVLSIVIGFGTAQILFRYAGQAKSPAERRGIAANVFGLAVAIGVVSMIVTQLAAPKIADTLPGGVTELQARLILGSLSVTGFILVPMSWLRMREKAVAYLFVSLGYAAGQAILSTFLLINGYGIDGVLAAGLAMAIVVASVLSVFQLRETGIRLDRAMALGHAHFGGVMVLAGAAAFVMGSLDRWFLVGAIGAAEMGIYALAAKLGLMAAVACQPFELWWLPRQFSVLNSENGETKCARTAELGLVQCMLAAILIAACGPLVIKTMTPVEYHQAIDYVPWLCGLAVLATAGKLVNLACISVERTIWPVVIDGASATVALVLYLLLIPSMGTTGAMLATLVALLIRLAAYIIVGQRVRPIPYRCFRLIALAMMTAGVLYLLSLQSGIAGGIAIGSVGLTIVSVAAVFLKLVQLPGRARWLGPQVQVLAE